MGHNFLLLMAGMMVLVDLLGFHPASAQTTTSKTYELAQLTPAWTTGIISDWVGAAGILATDLNQDGITDIASCSSDNAYVLNYTPTGSYDTSWFSKNLRCGRIAAGDRDEDGYQELYIATFDGPVLIVNSKDYHNVGEIDLPTGAYANDVAVADVDNDGAQEIVLALASETRVYDGSSLKLEWDANGYGGGRVKVANIDNDPIPEVIVNGTTAYVLNASQKSLKWAYSGGFGNAMDVGDVDGDARAEIAYLSNYSSAYVFDGDTKSIKWQRDNLGDLSNLVVADVNGDGSDELIIGNGQWGNLAGYRGDNGASLWRIANPEHGVSGIAIGDANNDGTKEIIWGAGLSSTGKDVLIIGDWVTQKVTWVSADLDGPLHVATGDVDADGQTEIVLASYSTSSGYDGGTISVYDGLTHTREWSTVLPSGYFDIYQVVVGQLDTDPALEILIFGDNWYTPRLQAYDGLSAKLEWQSSTLPGNSVSSISIADVDGDDIDEIVYAANNSHVIVFNGASNLIEWDSGALDTLAFDTSFGDLNGDGVLDLAVLTGQSAYVFRTDTWTKEIQKPVTNGKQIAISNSDGIGGGELLIVTTDDENYSVMQVWSGLDFGFVQNKPLGTAVISDMITADLDADTAQEILFIGRSKDNSNNQTYLKIASLAYPRFWETQVDRAMGAVNTAAIADVDQDGKSEVVLGGDSLIQEEKIYTSTVNLSDTFLPFLRKDLVARGIYGVVTMNGQPAVGVMLSLRFYNGSTWSTAATTTTLAEGYYSFTSASTLGSSQAYYVLYANQDSNDTSRLYTWHTQSIKTYQSGSAVHIGDFDIANIALVSPHTYDNTRPLPVVFEWTPRPASPKDSYEFNLYNPYSTSTFFYTDPPLGYVGSYTLTSLPSGFSNGAEYVWEIWAYSPDGGFGISKESRWIIFTNNTYGPAIAGSLEKSWDRLDIVP
jgi:hypothetical protein